MRKSCTDDHPQHKYRGIAIAFARQEELPAGTAACEYERQTSQRHPQKVPKPIGMGHRLSCKAGLKMP
jgi:hypothetical protein